MDKGSVNMEIFDLSLKTKTFWSASFDSIPSEKLYQDNDEIKVICEVLKS